AAGICRGRAARVAGAAEKNPGDQWQGEWRGRIGADRKWKFIWRRIPDFSAGGHARRVAGSVRIFTRELADAVSLRAAIVDSRDAAKRGNGKLPERIADADERIARAVRGGRRIRRLPAGDIFDAPDAIAGDRAAYFRQRYTKAGGRFRHSVRVVVTSLKVDCSNLRKRRPPGSRAVWL